MVTGRLGHIVRHVGSRYWSCSRSGCRTPCILVVSSYSASSWWSRSSLGIYTAVHQYSLVDQVVTTLAFIGIAVPSFWLGLLLLIFFAVGYAQSRAAVLPGRWHVRPDRRSDHPADSLASGAALRNPGDRHHGRLHPLRAGVDARSDRPGLHPNGAREGSLGTANAAPTRVQERRDSAGHAGRALDMPRFLSGSIVVESIFAWPGMGRLFWEHAERTDIPVLMAMLLFTSVLVVVCNLLADVGYAITSIRAIPLSMTPASRPDIGSRVLTDRAIAAAERLCRSLIAWPPPLSSPQARLAGASLWCRSALRGAAYRARSRRPTASIRPCSASRRHWGGHSAATTSVATSSGGSVYGGRISLTIGVVSIALAMTIGVVFGSIRATTAAWVDSLIMRLTDAMLSHSVALPAHRARQNPRSDRPDHIVVIGLFNWMQVTRIVRANFLTLKEQDFVLAARALGDLHLDHLPPHPAEHPGASHRRRDPRRRPRHHPRSVGELSRPGRPAANRKLGQHADSSAGTDDSGAMGGDLPRPDDPGHRHGDQLRRRRAARRPRSAGARLR